MKLWKIIPVRFWTKPCDGNCGKEGPHNADLSWLGRVALR